MHNLADQNPQQRELSARQIFDRITKGETVRIGNDPVIADQLKNHLNVIKSREKKFFLDHGLDFISSTISVLCIVSPTGPETTHYEIKLIAPKKRKTFTAFVVKANEPIAS